MIEWWSELYLWIKLLWMKPAAAWREAHRSKFGWKVKTFFIFHFSHRSDLSKSELSVGEEIEEVSIEGPDISDKVIRPLGFSACPSLGLVPRLNLLLLFVLFRSSTKPLRTWASLSSVRVTEPITWRRWPDSPIIFHSWLSCFTPLCLLNI